MFTPDNCVLVIIDVQEKLASVMNDIDPVINNVKILVLSFKIFDANIINCRQYPKALGPTVVPVLEVLGDHQPVDKLTFSSFSEETFKAELEKTGCKKVVLCGIESHVCVYQTAVELVEAGYEVAVICDAITSRTPQSKDIAIKRMAQENIKLYTTEMLLFEMLQSSKHPDFKEISKLIK